MPIKKAKPDPEYDSIVDYIKIETAASRKAGRRFRLTKSAEVLAKDSLIVIERLQIDLEKYLRTKMPAVARRIRSRGKVLAILSKEFRRQSVK